MAETSSPLIIKPNDVIVTVRDSRTELEAAHGLNVPQPRDPSWHDVWPQVFSSIISLSTVIQSGINLAYSGVLIPQLANDPNIKGFTKHHASWIASLLVVSQPFGALFVGPFMDYIGRKKTCIITNIPTIFGWIITYFTVDSLWPIYLARILAGFSSGMATVGVVYTAEVSHAEFRPVLLSMNSVNAAFGILIATILGVYIEWHSAALVYGSLAVFSLILSFYIPESPYWLANFTDSPVNEIKKKVRFLNRTEQLYSEEWGRIQTVIDERNHETRQNSDNNRSKISNIATKFKVFGERTSYVPLFLLMVLFLLQQTSGTYVVIFYTVNVFKSVGSNYGFGFNEYNATTALGVLRFLMSIISAVISKKVGRRFILMISSFGMAVTCMMLVFFFKFNDINTLQFDGNQTEFNSNLTTPQTDTAEPPINNWWILIALLGFVSAGAFGQMVIPWTLMGELLPTKIRASGSGFLVSYASVILFVVIKTFPFIIDYITLPYVFLSYAVMSALAIVFVYYCLPETFGKSFIEIAKYFEKT